MNVSESYWRALCITLGVLIGYFIFYPQANTTVVIQLGIPAPIAGVPEWQERDVKCLRDVIYNEARNQPTSGQIAVGATVLNRVVDERWPNSVCSVTRQRGQFSSRAPVPRNGIERQALERAEGTAIYTLNAYAILVPQLKGFYYFRSGRPSPDCGTAIGDHVFYEEYWS